MAPRLFAVVGSPGSGKDILIRAVNDLGSRHAKIVPKHTDRMVRRDEGQEMFFPGDVKHNFKSCDIVYENYRNHYGIVSSDIWTGLYNGFNQVVVVSNVQAVNSLKMRFGGLLVLVYVHSVISPAEFCRLESGTPSDVTDDYIDRRSESSSYNASLDFYTKNIPAFDHVLIYSQAPEDLYDQVFRLFESYKSK